MPFASPATRRAASLIELLVVLFIMGIMMGMLLPALQNARNRAHVTVCENNVYQLNAAMHQCLEVYKEFPAPQYWTVALLPWIEQRPLGDAIKHNRDPAACFPRPQLMRCPLQDDPPSRIETVGTCHYVMVVDRFPNGMVERGWVIQDRPILTDDTLHDPWHAGPEITYAMQADILAKEEGPHPSGTYMSTAGAWSR
jgi:hypothetical protein